MKKVKKVNNRLLYSLISLGLLLLIISGVYATINPVTDAYHSADKINFTGIEINPLKIVTDTLCIGVDCKTSWPSAVVGGTGGSCPDGSTPSDYVYTNNGEDTMSGFTSQELTDDTCGTPTTTGVTDAATYCAISDKKTCNDIYAVSTDDGATNVLRVHYDACTSSDIDTCDGDFGFTPYSCPLGTVKQCIDYYSTSGYTGYNCYKRDIQCRNNAQTVTCKQRITELIC